MATASFNGFVKGEYNASEIPAYSVSIARLRMDFFNTLMLLQPVQHIGITDMKIDNPDGINRTIPSWIFQKAISNSGKDPFDFRMLFKNPMTVQYYRRNGSQREIKPLRYHRFIGNFWQAPACHGMLDANATARGNLSTITKQQAGDFSANGNIDISGLNYSSPDFPQPIRNSHIQIAFQNPDGFASSHAP